MTEPAWLDCPYGRINDPYPGQCELYVDTNSDRLCDYSQPEGGVGEMKNFVFWSVFVILTVYFVHWYLVNKTKLGERFKWLGRVAFRYFWNLILLLTFIPIAISGLLWVFKVTNFDFTLWHNKAGIIFTIVATLHFLKRFHHFLKVPYR